MDNQQAVQGTEEAAITQQPLINPEAAMEAPENVQEAPIPLHEEAKADATQHTTDTDEEAPLERPDYYPEKLG